ncbi:esterase/lipase family protein [Amycolatopsis anabasis]|uniref:esterase/lipase family protein n=1 Tax=Amycolatopsis anabasis TaxID=1840409 RepID=UPI00131C4FF8|nr:alpha/beta fold hydrolase [Amycolatopsis anabasis]
MRSHVRSLVLAAAAALALAFADPSATASAEAAPAPPPIQENPAPLGANDWKCKPSKEHPRPVILVHGFGAPAAGHFSVYSPYLKAQGYCVFTGTYGTIPNVPLVNLLGGFQSIEYSAEQFSAFVDKVRAATGVDKVDIVGHSEGGIMPRYYIKNLGGTAKVHSYISWAPPNHGLTLSGLYTLGQKLIPGLDENILPLWPVTSELTNGKGFLDRLNAGDETPGDIHYTVIASKNEELVTPFTTSFLSGDNVDNLVLQDYFPDSFGEHIGLAFDTGVFKLTDKALQRN